MILKFTENEVENNKQALAKYKETKGSDYPFQVSQKGENFYFVFESIDPDKASVFLSEMAEMLWSTRGNEKKNELGVEITKIGFSYPGLELAENSLSYLKAARDNLDKVISKIENKL